MRYILAGLIACMAAGEVSAQVVDRRNVRGNRLRISTDGLGFLSLDAGRLPDEGSWDMALVGDYQSDPLLLSLVDGGGAITRQAALLRNRVDTRIQGSYAFLEGFQVALAVPYTLSQERAKLFWNDAVAASRGLGLRLERPASSGLGDPTLSLRGEVLEAEDQGIDLALGVHLGLPLASPTAAYLGERRGSVLTELAASRDLMDGRLQVAANLGALVRDNLAMREIDLNIDSELQGRVGASYDLGPASVQLAFEGFTELKNPFDLGNRGWPSGNTSRANLSGAEVLLGGEWKAMETLAVIGGAGTQLNGGYLVPEWRAFLGLRWIAHGKDSDGDKIKDDEDSCVDEAEDADGFEDGDGCPDTDNDGDGIADADDGAPDEAEDVDGFEDEDGVPDLDNDQDGLPDSEDACPDNAGPVEQRGCNDADEDGVDDSVDKCTDKKEDKDGFEDEDGCPDEDNDADSVTDAADKCPDIKGVIENAGCPDIDTDADGVVDRLDNCPEEAGTPENQGCKQAQQVAIRGCQIELRQNVYFRSGTSQVLRRSYSVLNNLASVLLKQDRITKVRIEGHTDSTGSTSANESLSQQRAQAVVNYLLSKGLTDQRVVAIGYGESRPVDSNSTPAGKANNRRVEVHIEDCQSSPAE